MTAHFSFFALRSERDITLVRTKIAYASLREDASRNQWMTFHGELKKTGERGFITA